MYTFHIFPDTELAFDAAQAVNEIADTNPDLFVLVRGSRAYAADTDTEWAYVDIVCICPDQQNPGQRLRYAKAGEWMKQFREYASEL